MSQPQPENTFKPTTTATNNPNPRIGIGVFILQSPSPETQNPNPNPTFIMGHRHGSTDAHTLALPGGHLEYGETFEDCAAREVLEETGLKVTDIKFLTATNDIMWDENKHYVTCFMVCRRIDEDQGKEAVVLEPEKCLGWKWVEWRDLVRWAEDGDGDGEEDTGEDGKVTKKGEGTGKGKHEKEEDPLPLFSPMIALVKQRPGVVPSLVW